MSSPSAPQNPQSIPEIAAYVDHMAWMMGLHLTPESRLNVIDNVERIQAIAAHVNEFPLPPELEAAPQFEP